MLQHLRANLWLLLFTLVLCSVGYPLALWAIAQAPMFRTQAEGSLVMSEDGKTPIGSKLIAQPFSDDSEYFQPRPSAAGANGYNAAASGASNWAPSNYLLRDRIARQLGPIVRYGKDARVDGKKPGELAGPDIEKWFQQDRFAKQPGIVAQWAGLHSGLAENWIKDTDAKLKPQWQQNGKDRDDGQSFLQQLKEDHPGLYKEVADRLAMDGLGSPSHVANAFFPLFSSRHPGQWLTVDEYEAPNKTKRKKLLPVTESSEIRAIFFDMWRQDHPNIALEEVPGDMVTASGSGLDPHITLKNAQYQLKYRVAEARVKKIVLESAKKRHKDFESREEKERKSIEEQVRKELEKKIGKGLEERVTEVIQDLLTQSAHAPLGGLAGVPLVNVLEINLAMDKRIKELVEKG